MNIKQIIKEQIDKVQIENILKNIISYTTNIDKLKNKVKTENEKITKDIPNFIKINLKDTPLYIKAKGNNKLNINKIEIRIDGTYIFINNKEIHDIFVDSNYKKNLYDLNFIHDIVLKLRNNNNNIYSVINKLNDKLFRAKNILLNLLKNKQIKTIYPNRTIKDIFIIQNIPMIKTNGELIKIEDFYKNFNNIEFYSDEELKSKEKDLSLHKRIK